MQPSPPFGLPGALTPLIGRASDLARSRALLPAETRLLTLTGPGGIGKTRLAIDVARDLTGAADGRWFVTLASIREPDLVLPEIARVLGLHETADRSLPDQARSFLSDREALLILDNVEQIPDLAPVVSDLLDAAPRLSVLVTSRSPIYVSGEMVLDIAPLSLPQGTDTAPDQIAASDAVTLFVNRARAVRPDFALTPDNAATLAEICRRLDGLPLAIELAAARIKVLAPAALLARLTNSLSLLSGGPTDQPSRLRTLRDAIAWSYDLLSPDDQTLFRHLSIFSGSFSLEAAEGQGARGWGLGTTREPGTGNREQDDRSFPGPQPLASSPFDGIASLVDKSLVVVSEGPGGEVRYRLLETVREFGLERLASAGELADTRQRHAYWVASWVDQAEREFVGSGESEWQERIAADLDNIRAALTWAIDAGDAETATQIAGALGSYWSFGGYLTEGRDWLKRALAIPTDAPSTTTRARALSAAGQIAWAVGALDEAEDMICQGLALHRKHGDQLRIANDLTWQSQVAWYRGDLNATEELAEQAIAVFDPAEANGWIATAWTMRAIAATRRGSPDARQRLEQALHQQQRASFSRGIVWTMQLIADLDHQEGKLQDAARRHQQSLALARETRNQWALFEEFAALAHLAAESALPREAAHLMGASQTLSSTSGVLPRTGRRRYEQTTEHATTRISPAEFAHELAVGRSLSTTAAADEAAHTINRLITGPSQPAPSPAPPDGPLSPRELEVLRLLAAGQTDQEIAETLYISHGTARTHTRNILAKLNVSSRAAAVAYGLQQGLIESKVESR